jgi:hypothetical protein
MKEEIFLTDNGRENNPQAVGGLKSHLVLHQVVGLVGAKLRAMQSQMPTAGTIKVTIEVLNSEGA